MADETGLTARLASFVGVGHTIRNAAKEVGCSERQAYRLAATEEFKSIIGKIRTDATGSMLASLSSSAAVAIETLTEIMSDREEKGQNRVSAARSVLSQLGPMMELHELRKRVEELEDKAESEVGDE